MKRIMILVLALVALGFATAESDAKLYPTTFTVVASAPALLTLTLEQPYYEWLGIEFAYGVSFRTDYKDEYAVAPFVTFSRYGDVHSWWMDFSLPTGLLNYVGLSETWFSFGYQYRW
jgi:hypothetical protein